MALETIDTFVQGKITPRLINASPTSQAKIVNGSGSKLFYKTASDVDTEDTEIAVGASATVEQVVWIISAGRSNVLLEHPTGLAIEDVTIGDDLVVKDTLKVTGATTPTGGLVTATAAPGFYAGGWHPVAATSGTDTTPAEKKLFVTSIFLPVNKTIKGIGYLVGSVGGTNKVVAGLWDAKGELLAHSSETTEGATVGTAAEIQELALTAEYKAVGPAVYFVGVTMNGNTARLRTIPKNTAGSNVLSEEISITTKNTLAKITAPTAFTADKGPVAWVY